MERIVFVIGGHLGSFPWTEFGQTEIRLDLKTNVLYMIYVCILLHDSVASIIEATDKFSTPSDHLSLRVLNFAKMMITILLPMLNILHAKYFKRRSWIRYFKKFHDVENSFRTLERKAWVTRSRKFDMLIVSCHLYLFGMVIVEFLVTYLVAGEIKMWYVYTLYNLYEMYNTILLIIAQTRMALHMIGHWEKLRLYLESTVYGNLHIMKKYTVSDDSKHILRLHMILSEQVEIYNDLFGMRIMFLFGFVMINILQICGIAIYYVKLHLSVAELTDLLHGPLLLVILALHFFSFSLKLQIFCRILRSLIKIIISQRRSLFLGRFYILVYIDG